MKIFERILVAVDFSEFSREALRIAAGLGRTFSSQVLVLHVCSLPRAVNPVSQAGQQRAIKALLALQEEVAQAARQKLHDWIEAEQWEKAQVVSEIGNGLPYRVITRMADRFEADLIVMGSYGRSGFARMLIGSTTEKVLRKSKVPVLAVTLRRPESPPPKES